MVVIFTVISTRMKASTMVVTRMTITVTIVAVTVVGRL